MFSRARMRALPLLTRVNERNLENVDGEELTSKKLMSKFSLHKFVKPDAMVIPDEDEGDGD